VFNRWTFDPPKFEKWLADLEADARRRSRTEDAA
jgi:hypothetical protein